MSKETKELDRKDTTPRRTVTPSVYVSETKDGYEITFELPGVGKDDISLDVENRTLVLSTSTKFTEPEGCDCTLREFAIRDYAVSLDMPEHADPNTVKASVANGVLTVALSKRAELKPRKIEID